MQVINAHRTEMIINKQTKRPVAARGRDGCLLPSVMEIMLLFAGISVTGWIWRRTASLCFSKCPLIYTCLCVCSMSVALGVWCTDVLHPREAGVVKSAIKIHETGRTKMIFTTTKYLAMFLLVCFIYFHLYSTQVFIFYSSFPMAKKAARCRT